MSSLDMRRAVNSGSPYSIDVQIIANICKLIKHFYSSFVLISCWFLPFYATQNELNRCLCVFFARFPLRLGRVLELERDQPVLFSLVRWIELNPGAIAFFIDCRKHGRIISAAFIFHHFLDQPLQHPI